VTVVPALPYTLAGDPTAVAVGALDKFALRPLIDDNPASSATLAALSAGSSLEVPTSTALAQLAATAARRPAMVQPGGGAVYEDHPWSSQFRQIAQLAHAGIGLRAAVVETVGWDLHADMGTATEGTMRDLLGHLAAGISSFADDVSDQLDSTTVVVLSEFGRRLAQNGNGGTDHGHGGLMMVLGGGIAGGRVYGRWPGLATDALDRGDVQVTTDFRDVLAEVVQRRLGNDRLDAVFPGYVPRFLGLAG
jgi:uncharacterized protein (DUF1501 family)